MIADFILAGPNGIFIPGDVQELYWGSAAFVLVMIPVVTKLVPFINKALTKAQKAAEAEAQTAERTMASTKAEIVAAENRLRDADAEGEKIIAEAREAASEYKTEAAGRTQKVVNDLWERAQGEVEDLKTQAAADFQTKVASTTAQAAEEVVKASMDTTRHNELIEDFVSKLSGLEVTEGAAVAQIQSAVALSDAQRESLQSALTSKLGSAIELQLEEDPSVVGGLVATVGDTVIDGSIRSRLNVLRESL